MALQILMNPAAAAQGGAGVGLMTAAGNPWTVSDEIAQTLVNQGRATPFNWLPRGVVSMAAENYGISTSATPKLNVSMMNLALSQNRVVTLNVPGQYLFGGPGQGGIIANARNTIICAAGVELILADATHLPLLTNKSALAAPVFTGQQVLWELGAPTFQCRIIQPGIEMEFPVGSWFGLLGLPNTDGNNIGFQGVYRVTSVALNTIRFHLKHQPPSGGNSAATASIYRAESGVHIFGGMWDGNRAGNPLRAANSVAPGEMRSHVLGFRNCQNIIVRGVELRRGPAWSIGSNNVRDVTVSDIDSFLIDTSTTAPDGTAFYQMSGGARNVLVQRISGSCGDNMVAASLDVIGAPGTETYLNHDPGDTYEIVIRDIHSRESNAAPVAFWGNTNYKHHSVVIERVTGKSADSMVKIFSGYAPTNMLNTNGGSLTIRNITGACNGSPVTIQSDGVWDSIDIDGVRSEAVGSSPMVNILMSATPQSLRSVKIRNVAQGINMAIFDRNAPVIAISNSNIEDLRIEGGPSVRLSAGVSAVVFSGTQGSIGKATVTGMAAVGAAAGDCFVVSCENTNATALGLLTVRDCGFVGTAASGGIVRQATTGRVTRIRLDNNTTVTGENASGVVRDNVTGGQTAVLDTVSVATT